MGARAMTQRTIQGTAAGLAAGAFLGWIAARSIAPNHGITGAVDPAVAVADEGDTTRPQGVEHHDRAERTFSCPDGGSLPTDAGAPEPVMEAASCAGMLMTDSASMLDMAEQSHHRALQLCLTHFVEGSDSSPRLPASTETCGTLSEQLWNQSDIDIRGYLEGLHMSYGLRRGPGRVLFADQACESMNDDQFGAALHVLSDAPDWVSIDFFRCAIAREHDESFRLFMLLRLAREIPGAREWVNQREFVEPNFVEAAAALR
jgi:hypothetical protein